MLMELRFSTRAIDNYIHNVIGHRVVGSPTGNCQMFSIAAAYKILDLYGKTSDVNQEIITIKKYFKDAAKVSDKRLCLIDIESYYIAIVEKVFNDEIVFKNEYLSTNGSRMCVFLLKLPLAALY